MNSKCVDVLVIGAGPGGCATAARLAALGYDVMIVDSAQFPRDKTCGDGLSPLAVRMLRAMNVLTDVESSGAFRIDRVLIQSPMGGYSRARFHETLGSDDYALAIPRFVLDEILLRHASRHGANVMMRTRIDEVRRIDDKIDIVLARDLDSNTEFHIQPNHVVIAVGANIGFLRRNGFQIGTQGISIGARAYYSVSALALRDYALYFDHELIPGYGWIFPISDSMANIGIGVLRRRHTGTATHTLLDAFIARREREGVLRDVIRQSTVKGYPIRSDYSGQAISGSNWLMIGEAAGLVNPLTGEGIDLALLSGAIAADSIDKGIRSSQSYSLPYAMEIDRRFRYLFTGWRLSRDLLLRPYVMDHIVSTMNYDEELRTLIVKMGLGLESPVRLAHPKWLFRVIRNRLGSGPVA